MWDLSREDDMVLTSSGIGDDSHREPVSKVTWVPDTSSLKKNKYLVRLIHSQSNYFSNMLKNSPMYILLEFSWNSELPEKITFDLIQLHKQ